jgi:integrase
MRGHIRKRSAGSHQVIVSAGTDPITGKRLQVFRSVKGSRLEAERELTKLLRQIDTGSFADPGRETVSECFDRYMEHARTRTRAATWNRYLQLVRRHIVPTIGSVRLSKLRPAHIQSVVDTMLRQGLAPRTVIQAYRVLSVAFRQAVRWEIVAVNPVAAIRPPRAERPRLSVPDAGALAAILRAAETTQFHVPVAVAATTGLRRGEVLGLRWRDVDLEAGLVHISATLQRVAGELCFLDPKTDRSRRTVGLPVMTVDLLRKHRKEQGERRLLLGASWAAKDVVFDRGDGTPIDPGHFSHAFHRIATAAGQPHVRLHDLRHAFATVLLVQGIHPKIASEALGHASVGFTMDVYSHLLPSMQEVAARAVQEALSAAASGTISD